MSARHWADLGLGLPALSLCEMALFNTLNCGCDVVCTGWMQSVGLRLIVVPPPTQPYSRLAGHCPKEGTALFSLVGHIASGIGIPVVINQSAQGVQATRAPLSANINPL